jgi:hypothetical protein
MHSGIVHLIFPSGDQCYSLSSGGGRELFNNLRVSITSTRFAFRELKWKQEGWGYATPVMLVL